MLILHHYEMSPFSEKIRAMFGYAGLAWQSTTVAEMPPRPSIDALAGGYRKIPVAQRGADVFCDTRTITEELAAEAGRPELALSGVDDEVRAFVDHADLDIFLACILSANGPLMLKKMRQQTSSLHALRFILDRANMGLRAKYDASRGKAAKRKVAAHLEDLEARLRDRPYLFGEAPNIADFAAYHSLWFQRDLGESRYVRRFAHVDAWLDRIVAFGHGDREEITRERALDAARDGEPRPLPPQPADASPHALMHELVEVGPNDYGLDPVRGLLVSASASRLILARQHARCGLVHVHFPAAGYSVRRSTR